MGLKSRWERVCIAGAVSTNHNFSFVYGESLPSFAQL